MALLAQRLVRRVCLECREAYKPSDEDLLSIGIDPGDFASGKAKRVHFKGDEEKLPPRGKLFRAKDDGCPACLGAGYKGRTAIYELLIIDETMRQLAIKNADAQSMKMAAVTAGMRTLREDGAQKVLAGMTTTAEVLMITTQDSS
jgi:general secretion pathway protein E